MQSPINLSATEAKKDSSFKPLEFSEGWNKISGGVMENVGHTVQFTPRDKNAVTVTNMCGMYKLQQFHLHWGSCTGTGSEHAIDGRHAEAEIHFVLSKIDATDKSQRDYLTVIGVLLEEFNGNTNAPWSNFCVNAIQSKRSASVTVEELVLNEFLPENKSYCYYPGSLTTPPYSEVVQWFVMKEKIPIPSGFLEELRKVQGEDGTAIKENFRALQTVGDRVVSFYDSP